MGPTKIGTLLDSVASLSPLSVTVLAEILRKCLHGGMLLGLYQKPLVFTGQLQLYNEQYLHRTPIFHIWAHLEKQQWDFILLIRWHRYMNGCDIYMTKLLPWKASLWHWLVATPNSTSTLNHSLNRILIILLWMKTFQNQNVL